MDVKQIRYSTDNLGYLIFSHSDQSGKSEGMAIDAGNVEQTLNFAQKNDITIKYVTNTHAHYDHTPGNTEILNKTKAEFIDCKGILADKNYYLNNEKVILFPTPGHTKDSITFQADDFIITGDTLFNGTIGNCFSGDLRSFHKSLKRLITLPLDTKVYGGHDYVIESMSIARTIEKDNLDINSYIKRYNPDLIISTIADELKVNSYIRFNAPEMIKMLETKKVPSGTEYERFHSIMENY